MDLIGSLLELCDVLNQSWGDDSESDFFGRDGIEFCSVTATTFEHSKDIEYVNMTKILKLSGFHSRLDPLAKR